MNIPYLSVSSQAERNVFYFLNCTVFSTFMTINLVSATYMAFRMSSLFFYVFCWDTQTTPGMSDYPAVSTNPNIKINCTKKHHVMFTISKRPTVLKLKLFYPSMKNSVKC